MIIENGQLLWANTAIYLYNNYYDNTALIRVSVSTLDYTPNNYNYKL